MNRYWSFLNWWNRYWDTRVLAYHILKAALVGSIWYIMPLAMRAMGMPVNIQFDLARCVLLGLGYFLVKYYAVDSKK